MKKETMYGYDTDFLVKEKRAKSLKCGDLLFYGNELYWVDDIEVHHLKSWPDPAKKDFLKDGHHPNSLVVQCLNSQGDPWMGCFFFANETVQVVSEKDKERVMIECNYYE